MRAIVVCGFFMKSLKKHILKIWKKSWVPFGSYLLDSTADSAQFEWKWAGLAVLFSRYLPNGTHDFFQNFRICFFKDFIKNPQTTIALTFLTHIISGIDGVVCILRKNTIVGRSLTKVLLVVHKILKWPLKKRRRQHSQGIINKSDNSLTAGS